jgi:hypothetical protein
MRLASSSAEDGANLGVPEDVDKDSLGVAGDVVSLGVAGDEVTIRLPGLGHIDCAELYTITLKCVCFLILTTSSLKNMV